MLRSFVAPNRAPKENDTMSMTLLKAADLPVATRGIGASSEPTVTITATGQFRISKAAAAVFAGSKFVQLGWDGKVGESLTWDAQKGEKRKLAFLGVEKVQNGAVNYEHKDDGKGSVYFAGSRVCRLIGWPFGDAGNQKFEAVINEKNNSVVIELPEAVPPAPPKRPRKTKAQKAAETQQAASESGEEIKLEAE